MISLLLIGQLKIKNPAFFQTINKGNLDTSALYASGETNRLLVAAANIMVVKRLLVGVRKPTAKRRLVMSHVGRGGSNKRLCS